MKSVCGCGARGGPAAWSSRRAGSLPRSRPRWRRPAPGARASVGGLGGPFEAPHEIGLRVWRAVGPGGVVVAAVVLLALLAPVLAPHSLGAFDLTHRLSPPIWEARGDWTHPLGTDTLGRDVLSRILHGARTSLGIAGAAVLLAAALGILLGLLSGYAGSWADGVILRLAGIQ